MAEFPAPAEGLLLTYLVVSRDVARSRRFYPDERRPRTRLAAPAHSV